MCPLIYAFKDPHKNMLKQQMFYYYSRTYSPDIVHMKALHRLRRNRLLDGTDPRKGKKNKSVIYGAKSDKTVFTFSQL